MQSVLSRRSLLHLSTLAAMSSRQAKARAARPARAPSTVPKDPAGSGSLTIKGLFMHAWDLNDSGADKIMAWMQDSGLNWMAIAGCYHSGWFVHPHSPRRRAYITEGSVAYFHPDKTIFRGSPIKPIVASFAKETNWLAVAGKLLDKYGLHMVSWTIGSHNTRLAQKHPEFAQQNVFGDPIPHALSIGHDATRTYLKALCRDLAVNYPLYGIQLEAFGWMGLRHGHHHERDLTDLTPLEQELLAMCFNPQTVAKARAAGVDADKAREVVRATLEAAFKEAPDRPKGHPASMAELESGAPALKAYNQFRRELADSLVVEIKQESLKGTSCKLLLQSGYQKEVASAVDGFAAGVYGKLPAEVFKTVQQGRDLIPASWKGDYACFVRLGMGVPASQQQLREIVLAVKNGGSSGPIFYNYSESPEKMLGWIKGALEGL
ncbi:MAG: hypothetical protein FJW26_05770 [Acidimicrobiia bacterium]|nr:hypothetical protein [Acidimicrobiia bacterium]